MSGKGEKIFIWVCGCASGFALGILFGVLI